jgi:hypothetical protein
MKYAVIATIDDIMDCRVATGAKSAMAIAERFRSGGYVSIQFTDGFKDIPATDMEALANSFGTQG